MQFLSNINYNKNEILEIIFNNMMKLLKKRNYIKENFNETNLLKELKENKIIYFEDNKKISINFFDNDLKNISSGSVIDDYLNKKIN